VEVQTEEEEPSFWDEVTDWGSNAFDDLVDAMISDGRNTWKIPELDKNMMLLSSDSSIVPSGMEKYMNKNYTKWDVIKGFLQAPGWKVYNDATKGTKLENKATQNELIYNLSNNITDIMPEFVYDISLSYNFPFIAGGAVGYSKIMSFDKNKNAEYIHKGVGLSTPGFNILFGFGVVTGLEEISDYEGNFADLSANMILGADYAVWKKDDGGKVDSTMITINSFPGVGARYDDYELINEK